jgi:hypothetical protein
MLAGLSRASRTHALCFAVLVFAFDASRACAEADDSLYESRRAERALQQRALSIDPQPEGKRIAFVALAQEDVFAPDELIVPVVLPRFAPTWPNTFHALTQAEVIQRELLFREGDTYRQALVDESMRNLRALSIFSYVRITAVRTPDPSAVGVLVYSRDLWSLRLETLFEGTGDALYFTAQLSERNFLGKDKLLTARFDLDPKSFSLGELYVDPRLFGGELELRESFDVIFNRSRGDTEGSQASLVLGRPFRNLEQRDAWSAQVGYAVYVDRQLRGADIVSYRSAANGPPVPCDEPSPECVRSVWQDRSVLARASRSYRRGDRYKQTFTFGAGASDHAVLANEDTMLQPWQVPTFEQLLPFTRRQIYPYASYELWLPTYEVYRNLGTFGQSESVRVGPNVYGITTAPLSAFGSSTDSVTFEGALGYVLGDGQSLADAWATAKARLENGRVVDQELEGRLRGATPDALLGRIVAYADWSARRNDTSRTQVTLGGDNGLRGYPAGAFRVTGGSRLRANLEYRTLPLVISSVHLGGVLFYDLGTVYESLPSAKFHQGVGAGLRVLFSQFNPRPFCIDFGVPLDQHGFTVLLSYSSEQPIPMTASEDALDASVRPR